MDNIKKFEGFLDRMQGLLDNAKKQGHIIVRVEDLENAFPELKESEDERIRKDIISHFTKAIEGSSFDEVREKYRIWIAWLEKQGRQSICDVPSRNIILAIWDLGNEWKELTNGCISTEHGTQLEYIQKHWNESEYYLRAKQGEQKPIDKVEHLIPQKGAYYVCIKDYYSADGKRIHTKGKIYKSPYDGYINDDNGFGLSWINSCTENYFRPLKEKD